MALVRRLAFLVVCLPLASCGFGGLERTAFDPLLRSLVIRPLPR
jgi:hypothetical protein